MQRGEIYGGSCSLSRSVLLGEDRSLSNPGPLFVLIMTNETTVMGVTDQSSAADIDILITGVAVALFILATAVFVLLFRVARSSRRVVRVLNSVAMLVMFFTLPGLFDTIIIHLNQTHGVRWIIIDLGWSTKFAPGVTALIAAVLIHRCLTHETPTDSAL